MKYIVLEGMDGSGTTTHAKLLVDRLQAEAHEVVGIHEPTDGPIGKLTREFFSGVHGSLPSWRTMFNLFQADREYLFPMIRQHLQENRIVVSDRNYLSTLIYQSISADDEGTDGQDALDLMHKSNAHAPRPDLTVILDLPFEVAEARRLARRGPKWEPVDAYEAKEAFLRKVHRGYAHSKAAFIRHVDANRPKEEVCSEIFSLVSGLLT